MAKASQQNKRNLYELKRNLRKENAGRLDELKAEIAELKQKAGQAETNLELEY